MDIKIGVGSSKLLDAQAAGMEAVKSALKNAGTDTADFLLVWASAKFNQQALLSGIKEVTTAPMIGGSTAGEITSNGVQEKAVVITVFSSKEVNFSSGLGQTINKDAVQAGQQAAQLALQNCTKPNMRKSFLMFHDGLLGDGRAVVQGVQNVLGEDFEIVGAAVGDDARFEKTYQYFNYHVYENSVVGVLVSGDVITGVGMRAGWASIGNRMRCTKTEGRTLYELDGNPALTVYKRYLGPERSERLPAIAFEYPLGIINEKVLIENQEYLRLRAPLSISDEQGSMIFGAAIGANTEVAITAASRHQIIQAAEQAAEQAKATMSGAKPLLILNFAGVGRRLVLGPRAGEEIKAIHTIIGDQTPMAGFYSYGEIGPIDKRVNNLKLPRFHNQTTFLWILGTNVFE